MRFLLIVFSMFITCLNVFAQIVINEVLYDPVGVDTGQEWIELKNIGESAVNMNGTCLYACGKHYVFGDITLAANTLVVVRWRKDGVNSATELFTGSEGFTNMGNTAGSIALWSTHETHSKDTILDYFEYGDSNNSYDGTAESAGIWMDGDFIPDVETGHSIEYDGSGDSSSDYKDQPNPSPFVNNSVPVELSSFAYEVKNGCISLCWKTYSEIKCYGYYIEKGYSVQGEFKKISFLIPGAGTTTLPHTYYYKDIQFENNTVFYYRLLQIDFDGSYKYYEPLKVDLNISCNTNIIKQNHLLQNFPNPFNPATVVQLFLSPENFKSSHLCIYDILGRQICDLSQKLVGYGYQNILWNGCDDFGNETETGIYFCKLFSGNGSYSCLKLLKIK